MDPKMPSTFINDIQKQTLDALDDYMSLKKARQAEWFNVEYNSRYIPGSADDSNFLNIVFIPSSTTLNYQRAVYNILDLVGDVGGLLDGLKWIGFALIQPFVYNNSISAIA